MRYHRRQILISDNLHTYRPGCRGVVNTPSVKSELMPRLDESDARPGPKGLDTTAAFDYSRIWVFGGQELPTYMHSSNKIGKHGCCCLLMLTSLLMLRTNNEKGLATTLTFFNHLPCCLLIGLKACHIKNTVIFTADFMSKYMSFQIKKWPWESFLISVSTSQCIGIMHRYTRPGQVQVVWTQNQDWTEHYSRTGTKQYLMSLEISW